MLVVSYEDLQENTLWQVTKMMEFLQLPFNEQELSLLLQDDFITFKRPHREGTDFERYTAGQKRHIRNVVLKGIQLAKEANMLHILQLHEYL